MVEVTQAGRGYPDIRYFFPDPVGHFGLSGRLGVAGGAALQAVSRCPRRRQAGILKELICMKIEAQNGQNIRTFKENQHAEILWKIRNQEPVEPQLRYRLPLKVVYVGRFRSKLYQRNMMYIFTVLTLFSVLVTYCYTRSNIGTQLELSQQWAAC